ncbi:MAG: FAD-dependent oxidoreductase [SAR324 cluster bacterium]|nr:FAD-dependent oxidoreductase [SAR324 cluster bacterium]MBL7034967.1 FAD-dependent oxidoreductase [SAR324 cluster bacterium]
MDKSVLNDNCDVAIIGSGPAGLAAAILLKYSGIQKVVVLEREAEAGGIPRHCGHPPFGIREFKRILTGPKYAKKLVETALNAGVEIVLKTTVTSLGTEGELSLVSPEGPSQLSAKRVLLATGIRETPRSARFVSGSRALGICTTGTLQSMVYLKNRIPFRSPLVVGTEIVSFSALLTCKNAGIQPVAMLEEKPQPHVRWPIYQLTRWFCVPLLLQTSIVNILGTERVEAVQVSDENGNVREIACDGVLFTGQYTPESSLVRESHLELDPETNSPVVDSFGRCSDPVYFATGNMVQLPRNQARVPIFYLAENLPNPVDDAGQCWSQGRAVAKNIVKDLN